ncbi:uncharacterized protein LOC125206977 [Salvia hispanica]|uniref:uncharacterized protein LOC125206977 n=1 Tax=Salvia hispanica TaxID=49212 RepID=UPI0020099ADF|nr:uncharacterized protein LOC125206977 [Salvia hispanica]
MEEDEREMIDHWSHEHPLTLVDTRGGDHCYGCHARFSSGEQAYGCSINGCEFSNLIHAECASMAREIRHPLHPQPQHILIQRYKDTQWCQICSTWISSISYKCTISGCMFNTHLRCAHANGVINAATHDDDDDDGDEQRRVIIRHPSHPSHDLKLLRRRCPFKCDACGTTRRDSSYICTKDDCQYLIHQKCASLPQQLKREDHHHSLSLSFQVPPEYIIFDYKCDVCCISFLPNYWIYHCPLCRYIVHIKCAFDKLPRLAENIGKDVIHLPTNEVAGELITPFVMKQRGGTTFIPPIIIIPAADDTNELVNMKYKFLHHQHHLTLVSLDHQNQEEEEEEEEDEENYGVRSELICDGCISPISSSSSYYYMSCSECKYNLHIACFHLPPQLSSLSSHRQHDHHLFLQSGDKLRPWQWQDCMICRYPMNGLYYGCGKCGFDVDIKCACMPDTILHAAHPQHLLEHVTKSDLQRDVNSWRLTCAAGCSSDIPYYDCYRCCSSPCDFIVHVKCAVLPASVSSRRWDRHHPLLLTSDATLNRPGDFYCDQCETQMNPKRWMYHCRSCDISFHPQCFPTTSGKYRNIKLGKEYVIKDAIHPHPLTFQLLTTKCHCDICHCNENENQGFYCALCNFFICLYWCGGNMIINGVMKAVE